MNPDMNQDMNQEINIAELYQEIILEHYRATRNRRVISNHTHSQVADNPLCGDMLTLYARVDGDTISELSFQGQGCSICCASANMLCESVNSHNVSYAQNMYTLVHQMLTTDDASQSMQDIESAYEDLSALIGVRKFPLRIKCALLSWRALEQLLIEAAPN